MFTAGVKADVFAYWLRGGNIDSVLLGHTLLCSTAYNKNNKKNTKKLKQNYRISMIWWLVPVGNFLSWQVPAGEIPVLGGSRWKIPFLPVMVSSQAKHSDKLPCG